ncbi:hypothetical protein D4740_03805 [Actinomyces sp. 2119]|uniref:hypothetical protein n=1 Tax=Actinomyces sp. 2119 TaxID=2321393 RepID=UPI000E6B9BB7|nr:hypothetical protein [Actinomyces sp. 2119]RJF44057.1 hypothetical protein D4740_03805 [Actinomyces sp. 2119]
MVLAEEDEAAQGGEGSGESEGSESPEMVENRRKLAMERLKVRVVLAASGVGGDVGLTASVAATAVTAPAGVSDVAGGLAGAWDSPRAVEFAGSIDTGVQAVRDRVEEVQTDVQSAINQEEDQVPEGSDEADTKWDE